MIAWSMRSVIASASEAGRFALHLTAGEAIVGCAVSSSPAAQHCLLKVLGYNQSRQRAAADRSPEQAPGLAPVARKVDGGCCGG